MNFGALFQQLTHTQTHTHTHTHSLFSFCHFFVSHTHSISLSDRREISFCHCNTIVCAGRALTSVERREALSLFLLSPGIAPCTHTDTHTYTRTPTHTQTLHPYLYPSHTHTHTHRSLSLSLHLQSFSLSLCPPFIFFFIAAISTPLFYSSTPRSPFPLTPECAL